MHKGLTSQEWATFEQLPGAATDNFESLWRALVKGCYGGVGQFVQYKNHPGVEFLIRLSSPSAEFGDSGTVVGWQCKYFQSLRTGRALTPTQRREIEKSLQETRDRCPEVNRWILCVPAKLPKRDVQWLSGTSTESLHVDWWDDTDIVGKIDQAFNGELIRAAYFGCLAFTADDLLYASRVAYEPIKSRWLKDVHFCTDAEREIRRLLFEPEARNDFAVAVANLSEVKPYFQEADDKRRSELLQLVEEIENTANGLVASFTDGEWFDGRELHEKVVCAARQLRAVTIQLKRERNSLAIVTQNALYFIRQIDEIARGIIRDVDVPSVAVVADAGCGKTHMSIALVENGSLHRSGGVLMLAKELSREADIESLIDKICLRSGHKIKSVVELLVALNEYGERNKCRVPWVIDGLNESQDPSQWKEILARISLLIKNDYPRVLLVVTLRTGQCSTSPYYHHNWVADDQLYAYKNVCIPDDVKCIVGRVPDDYQLVQAYFEYYKIWYSGSIPQMLRHPLSLRLYCQLTNKDRKKEVFPQSLPYDISDVFNAYCDEIAKHISENKAIANRKRAADYRRNIQDLGKCVWDACDRAVPIECLYAIFPTVEGGWESEWENVLSHEGLILVRPDWADRRKKVFEIAFDALSGYLVADWLLTQPKEWLCGLLKSQEFAERIAKRKHLLGEDILSFMVWLFPRINYGDAFYNIVTGDIRDAALRKTIDIDGKYINSKIRADFVRQCRVDERFAESCYYRIFSRSFVTNHPVDSVFLDEALTPFAVAERDASWGRWVYQNRKGIFERLSHILDNVQHVSQSKIRQLFFILQWLLVSNVCSIRDRATHIIVEIGARFPKDALEMISSAFACNDPYVVERLAAAGYGILMRLYSKWQDKKLVEIGTKYVQYLIEHVLGERANFPIVNQLALDAMVNSIALLREVEQECVPDAVASFKIPYSVSRHNFRKPEDIDSRACAYVDQAIHMDFANYTLTGLVGTHPYETSGRRYKDIHAQIEQRMYDLGFRCDDFKDEDSAISQNRYRPAFDRDKLSVERFGKKYAWMAFREMESVVRKKVCAYNRTSEIDIDPSFPGVPRAFPIAFCDDIFSKTSDVEDWIENGILPTYNELRECKLKGYGDDDWVMIFGAIDRESDDKIKNCVTLIKGFFVKRGTMSAVSEYPRQLEELEAVHKSYAYVGESPWSKQLRYCEDDPRRSLKEPKPDRCQFLVGSDEKWDYYLWFDCPYEFFNSEAHSSDENKGATGYLLSHYVLQKLHMRIDPVSWNAVDQEGRTGAVYFKDGESYNTERRFLYIRKDLLCKYMKAEGADFGWRVFGERRMHYNETPKHEEFLRKLGWEKTCVNLIQQYNPNFADVQGRIKVLRDLNCKEDEGI